MNGKVFPREVKLSVVRELEAGKPVEELCRKYEVSTNSVNRWRREYNEGVERAFPGKGKVSSLEAQNAELERTVGRLYLQIELLKKALKTLETKLAEQKTR